MTVSEMYEVSQSGSEHGSGKIRVQVRSNAGQDSFLDASTLQESLSIAKKARNPQNHMVCIEISEDRTQRWDRDRIVGSNRWKKVDLNKMETIGQIREIVRPS